MKIALSGASSTGKTTLCRAICDLHTNFRVLNVDARALLRRLGHRNVISMSDHDYHHFQTEYINEKTILEVGSSYITERSFLDAFVYWEDRCLHLVSESERQKWMDICRARSQRYDLHIFLPFGVIPFVPDGYRHPSPAYHQKISERIQKLLDEWNLPHIVCDQAVLSKRLDVCERALSALRSI